VVVALVVAVVVVADDWKCPATATATTTSTTTTFWSWVAGVACSVISVVHPDPTGIELACLGQGGAGGGVRQGLEPI
jgi:hypothetical protein